MWVVAMLSAFLVVYAPAAPGGAQVLPPVPPVQNQAGQTPQAELSAGAPSQASVGLTSGESFVGGSSTSSAARKRFGSAGRGLPGMPGGPPIKGSMGYQDPSGRYMRPPLIPPLFCDPAINISC